MATSLSPPSSVVLSCFSSFFHPPLTRFKPSGKIDSSAPPPPSSRYGPSSSKTKHPKGWAATLTAKRPSNAPGKQAEDRKRKRTRKRFQDAETPATPTQKRPRPSPQRSPIEDKIGSISRKETNPLEYWRNKFRWPEEYSELESSILYTRPGYETVLATKGSFMGKCELGITDDSKRLCQTFLTAAQPIPQDTLFRDDLFEETCESVRSRNEAMAVRDISPLICPSAQNLRIYGAKHLKPLIESVNEGWNNAISFCGPRPQPDYSVGFGRSAFTVDQLEKLKPFVREVADTSTSHFMATWQMYFPFLTCEVKCGAAALDVADRQNAHSMTIAVRGMIELFRLVKREKELHREILAFSISHDHSTVRIYGHYALIDGSKTAFYRHPIKKFDFTSEEGKDKWTSYKFTKNIYDIWIPTHLKRICSVIDELPPDLNFEVSEQSEPVESGLSQGLESHHLSGHDVAVLEEADSQPSRVSSRDVTPAWISEFVAAMSRFKVMVESKRRRF
ncbi:hypothetical protein ACHAP3_008864 [Botrytis cinerea]